MFNMSITTLSSNEIQHVSGAMAVSGFGCTLSNGGNDANTWYQTGVWATAGAIGGSLGGWAGAGIGAAGGAVGGFLGSFTLSCQ
jgi:hypothetical protein